MTQKRNFPPSGFRSLPGSGSGGFSLERTSCIPAWDGLPLLPLPSGCSEGCGSQAGAGWRSLPHRQFLSSLMVKGIVSILALGFIFGENSGITGQRRICVVWTRLWREGPIPSIIDDKIIFPRIADETRLAFWDKALIIVRGFHYILLFLPDETLNHLS